MRRRRRERLHLNAEINVVSLIDVMLLLLVIFMITAPMMQGGLDIRLPRADARPLEAKAGFVVTINRAGTIDADGTPLEFDQFRGSFKALVGQKAAQGIYLRADEGVPYGTVVRVLGVMRSAGVGDVGLVTEAEEIP